MRNCLPIVWMLFLFTAKAQPILDYSFKHYPVNGAPSGLLIESIASDNPIPSSLNGDKLVAQHIDFWNSAEMAWTISDSLSYAYDADGQLLNIISRRLTEGEWSFVKRIDYTYNDDKLLASTITSSWGDTGWELTQSDERITYTYNEGQQMTSRIIEYREADSWQNSEQRIWSYDPGSQLLLSQSVAYWVDGMWLNSLRGRYLEYDDMENPIEEELDEWLNDEWTPIIRFLKSYTSTNSLLERLWYRFSIDNEEWELSRRRTFTYDVDGLLLNRLDETWTEVEGAQAWLPDVREDYEYSPEGYLLYLCNKFWDGSLEDWRNSYGISYEYNEEGQEVYRLNERWNSSSNIWENVIQQYFFYGDGLTGMVNVSNAQIAPISVFPNPSNGQARVKFSAAVQEAEKKAFVSVYTLDGRLAKEMGAYAVNNSTISLDLRNLLPGSYVIHVMAGLRHWAHFVELQK